MIKLLFILVLLFQIEIVQATDYYVRTDGNNSNNGLTNTSSGAWLTLQKAADTMVAGDITWVQPGIYTSGNISFATSGGNTTPITLRSQSQHKAIISSTSGCLAKISINASNVIIDGFYLKTDAGNTPCGGHNSTDGTGVRAYAGGVPTLSGTQDTVYRGVIVRNTYHEDCGGACSHSIKIEGDDAQAYNNVAYNGIESGFGRGIKVFSNKVLGVDGFGNGLGCGKFGSRNTECYNNYVVCTAAWEAVIFIGGGSSEGLHWDETTDYEAYNSVAYNNVFDISGSPTPCHIVFQGAKDSYLLHNVIKGDSYQIAFYNGGGASAASPDNPTIKNNTVISTNACLYDPTNYTGTLTINYNNFRNCTSPPSQTNNVAGDPNLNSNFIPNSGSPLIDAAEFITSIPAYPSGSITLNRTSSPFWLEGGFRPVSNDEIHDVGAFESPYSAVLNGPGFKRHKGSSPEKMGSFGFRSYPEFDSYQNIP
jgi:hypothetical protein